MFQNLMSQLQEDDNPCLHWMPFIIIWISAYAMSWFAGASALVIGYDIQNTFSVGWFENPPDWFAYVAIGVIYGAVLAIIQSWALQRRFGFVPHFWRAATFIGSVVALYSLDIIWRNSSGIDEWSQGLVWFGILNLFQAAVIFRVNRHSWWLALIGIVAGLVAGAIMYFDIPSYNDFPLAALLGTGIQAVGTAIVMLRLIANPREGIVPKRDSDEKAKKTPIRHGLHPVTLIAFWASAYMIAWGTLMAISSFWNPLFRNIDVIRSIGRWINRNAVWVIGLFWGGTLGMLIAIAQKWLMQQYRKTDIRHWVLLSTIAYAIAGMGLYFYLNSTTTDTNFERLSYLALWFITPAAFQTILMWRAMRGGWIWLGTGIASAIIAILIDTQLARLYNGELYVVVVGAVVQAIISGMTYIMLSSQQTNTEQVITTVDV